MSAGSTFKKALEAFTKASVALSCSETLNSYRRSDKAITTDLANLDKVAGSSSEAMWSAIGKFENSSKKYLEDLVKQADKEKANKEALKKEAIKLRLAVLAIITDYKKDIVKLEATEKKMAEKGSDEAKKKLASISNDVAQAANDRKFKQAVDLLHSSRKKELDSQRVLKTSMENVLQSITNLKNNAQKALKEAETKASTKEGAELAISTAKVIAKMASDAEKLADNADSKRDKQQKEFMEFRNGLNWKATANKFDLSEVAYEKKYAVELKKSEPLYSESIKLGSQSLMICRSMGQTANEIFSMVEVCKSYALSANEALKMVLNDLRSASGKTNRAAFDLALSNDPKKSFFHLAHKVLESEGRLLENLKDWVVCNKNKDELGMEDAASKCKMLWGGIDSSFDDMKAAYELGKSAMANAKDKVPNSLKDHKEVKLALQEMGGVMVKATRELTEVTNKVNAAKVAITNVGILK
jgi:hypothetical protein